MSSSGVEPLVTVLIPSHNRPEELRLTLRELTRQSYERLEVIVIDDGSEPDLAALVAEEYPAAQSWRNRERVGYVRCRNVGMARSRGELIVSLDDDASFMAPDSIARAVWRMLAEPEVGILTFFVHNTPTLPTVPPHTERARYVHTFVGCAHMLRREVVESVGGYREFFEYYAEEAEYALRALAAGWRILFFPSIVVHHRISDVGRDLDRIFAFAMRNSVWNAVLNLPWPDVAWRSAWKLGVYSAQALSRLRVRWHIRGLASLACGLPMVLRLREPVSRAVVEVLDKLQYRTVTDWREVQPGRPVSLRERVRYWRTVWRHRARPRPIWHLRGGSVGKSPMASNPWDHR